LHILSHIIQSHVKISAGDEIILRQTLRLVS